MSQKLNVLSRIRVASPCFEPWAQMRGDDHVRHCGRCNFKVYNLSSLTSAEAEELILSHEGRLCVRFFQRQDGTILTRDCPVGAGVVRRKLARFVGIAAAAFAFLAGGLHAIARGVQRSDEVRLRYLKPFDAIIGWLAPQPKLLEVEGISIYE